jgi:hypothetical protein
VTWTPPLRFVSTDELEFFLLTRALTQNSNNVELEKFPEKNQRLHIQFRAVALKITSCRTMSKNKNWKKKWKCKIYGQNTLLFWHYALKSLILFKKFYKFHSVGILSQGPIKALVKAPVNP